MVGYGLEEGRAVDGGLDGCQPGPENVGLELDVEGWAEGEC